MSHEVVVYLGPARCGKTRQLLRQYRDALDKRPAGHVGTVRWLAPTTHAAAATREQLIDDGLESCLYPGVMTFDDLAAEILDRAPTTLRRLNQGMERELARRAIGAALDAGELSLYAKAARREGFLDLLREHFRELRRHGVDADCYARRRPRVGNQQGHTELASLYRRYQQLLDANRLADAEGAPWAACDVLAGEPNVAALQTKLIVVDGFTDFTAAQHKLLQILAARTQQLLVSLPYECETLSHSHGRRDLFTKTAATLAELRRLHPKLIERHFAPQPSNWPAIDYLTSQVFRDPSRIPPATADVIASLDHIDVIEAAGAQDEVVQLARRIKHLLIPLPSKDGSQASPLPSKEGAGEGSSLTGDSGGRPARPHDIVVIFRSLADVAPRIRQVFSQFGIPFSLETREHLVNTGLFQTLLALLRLHEEDWPFRRTVAVVTNNTITTSEPAARQAADWLIRDLQIAKGRRSLLERVGQLAADPSPAEQLGHFAQRRVAAAKTALPALQLLADALDKLPAEATPLEWINALARLGTTLGLPTFTAALPHDPSSSEHADALAWQCLREHFASLERLDRWLGQPPKKLSRRDLIAALLDAATHESLPRPHDDVGRVRILSAPTARNNSAKHLFLAGMSEQAFPAAERAGRLATEAEYHFLSRAASKQDRAPPDLPASDGVPMPTRTHEEMLLFYEVLARAGETLTISYPALDDKAQQLPPSPYVIELKRVLGAEEDPSRLRCDPPYLSPVPQRDSPLGIADWRIRAVANALDKSGDGGLLAGIFADERVRPLGAAIDAGLRIVHARVGRDSFSSAEGMLTSAAAVARFAERFGPVHHWSPSQWETYAACPYKFFLEHVLGLEPLGDLVLETDHMRRGSRLHHVLADFHRRWQSRSQNSLPLEEEAAAFLHELTTVLEERTAITTPGGIEAALLELDRRQIRKWADGHFEHHMRYGEHCAKWSSQFAAAHFEFRFGPGRPGDAEADDPDSCDEPFELEIDGERVLVTGRVDRIDVARNGDNVLFNVIDYKSGRRPSLKHDHIATGEHLQLPIYVAAAQALLFGGNAHPVAAGYWTMATGFDAKGVLAVHHDDEGGKRWAEIDRTVRKRIGQFIQAIRQGDFRVASQDDKCTSRCDFNTICRIAQVRSLGKIPPIDDVSDGPKVNSRESRVKSRKRADT